MSSLEAGGDRGCVDRPAAVSSPSHEPRPMVFDTARNPIAEHNAVVDLLRSSRCSAAAPLLLLKTILLQIFPRPARIEDLAIHYNVDPCRKALHRPDGTSNIENRIAHSEPRGLH